MPISTIMLVTVASACTRCETGASTPMVAATLVPASSTGHAGGDQRAERQQHQHQRHRQAERLRGRTGRRRPARRSAASRLTSPDSRTSSDGKSACTAVGHRLERRRRRPGRGRAGPRRGTPCRPGWPAGSATSSTPSSSRHAGDDRGGGLAAAWPGRGSPSAARDQDVLGVGLVEAGRGRPARRRGRTRRAGSRRRWSPGSGPWWPGRPRRRRARPSRGSPATGAGRTSGRCGGRGMRVGFVMAPAFGPPTRSGQGSQDPTRGGASTTVRDGRASARMEP